MASFFCAFDLFEHDVVIARCAVPAIIGCLFVCVFGGNIGSVFNTILSLSNNSICCVRFLPFCFYFVRFDVEIGDLFLS